MCWWPRFQAWGPVSQRWMWSIGWWTGPDKDLLCVVPSAQTSSAAEIALSPVCDSRVLALLAFCLKAALLRIDHNAIRKLREPQSVRKIRRKPRLCAKTEAESPNSALQEPQRS